MHGKNRRVASSEWSVKHQRSTPTSDRWKLRSLGEEVCRLHEPTTSGFPGFLHWNRGFINCVIVKSYKSHQTFGAVLEVRKGLTSYFWAPSLTSFVCPYHQGLLQTRNSQRTNRKMLPLLPDCCVVATPGFIFDIRHAKNTFSHGKNEWLQCFERRHKRQRKIKGNTLTVGFKSKAFDSATKLVCIASSASIEGQFLALLRNLLEKYLNDKWISLK